MGEEILGSAAKKVCEKGMNFDVIKRDEVRVMYEQAADKRRQVAIMAELMACEEADICDILGIPHTKKRRTGHINEAEALKMHRRGASDAEIADTFGVTKEAVKAWKWRNGLVEVSDEVKAKYAHCRELYDLGMNDTEIANLTGINRKSVCDWRKQNKLQPNKKPVRDWEEIDAKFMPLYEQGMNDQEIAEKFGINYWNVRTWRKRHGLKSHRPCGRLTSEGKRVDWNEEDRRYRPWYEQGFNDPQIAKLTFSEKRKVCDWRHKFNLPANGRNNK